MNYINDDYLLGHLLKQARTTKLNCLQIDILQNRAVSEQLLTPPIRNAIERWNKWFPALVESSGSTMEFVKSTTLTIEFDLNTTKPNSVYHNVIGSSFSCEMSIIDDRGKEYNYRHEGWW